MMDNVETAFDDVMHANGIDRRYDKLMLKECPHPEVRKQYSVDGHCRVHPFTCKKCKCALRTPLGRIYCGYGPGREQAEKDALKAEENYQEKFGDFRNFSH